MCGRYILRGRREQIAIALGDITPPLFEDFDERPRFNIAPSQSVPIVRLNKHQQPVLNCVQWGLIPSWTKGAPKTRPINARSETVAKSAMFRQAFDRRRCLVPSDGFYEWQGARPPKQPWFIHLRNHGIFCFAGLWERWRPDESQPPIDTVAVLTTTANAVLEPIHARMPVILAPADYGRWLDRAIPGSGVTDLLAPYAAEEMTAERVSTRVNSVKNDGPELIAASPD